MKKAFLFILLAANHVFAQPPVDLRERARALIRAQPGNPRFDAHAELWNGLIMNLQTGIEPGAGQDQVAADILARRRADVKNGAGNSSAGSTAAVLNPLLPAAFGFAFENGSVLRTISGTTATVSINPAGLLCAARSEAALVSRRESGCFDTWRKVGATLSFDTARGKQPAAAANLKPLSNQFSAASIRYEIYNERQPSSQRFRNRLEEWKKQAMAAANTKLLLDIKLRPLEQELQRRLNAELDSTSFPKLPEERQIDLLVGIIDDVRGRLPSGDPLIQEAATTWAGMLRASNSVYNSFAHGLVLTAEYSLQRPDIAAAAIADIVPKDVRPPNLHTARLVVARGLVTYNIDFTVNLSSSWFQERLAGMTSFWRDTQVAADVKFRLHDIADFGTPVLSVAGLWLHLHQRPLGIEIPTFVGTKVNQPGNIGVFQTKLELPTANAALRVPISFTYSNRTDLIKESDVRGQVGVSLNLDSLFADPSKK
jgi:hypothetical protein